MNKMFPEHRGKIYSGPKQPVAILARYNDGWIQ